MTPDVPLLEQLDELERDGLLIRADKSPKNPVGDFNSCYTYLAARLPARP